MPLLQPPDMLEHSQNFSTEQKEPLSNQKGRCLPSPPPALIQLNKRLTITYSALGPVLSDGIGLGTEGFSDDGECTRPAGPARAAASPLA